MNKHGSFSIIYLFFLIALSGCDKYPRDPNESLKKISNSQMVVGITTHHHAEAERIASAFAKSLNADIRWVKGSEGNLFHKLKDNEIHLLLSDLSSDTPWKDEVALTGDKKLIFALPPGENALLMRFETFLFETLKREQR